MPISKVIAKARPEFAELDFDVLRAEGISHLENFATELWTDYNAHDPGITLLELLCYAITDLGYRTRMIPVKDILAGPDPNSQEWFAAADVLPSSPVTRLDYRKWLIDTKGVKNAWLQPSLFKALRSTGVVFPELMADAETTLSSTPRTSDIREYNDFVFDIKKLTQLLAVNETHIISKADLEIGNVPVTSFKFTTESSTTPDLGVLLIDNDFVDLVAAGLNDEIAIKASFPAIREYVEQLELLGIAFTEIAQLEIREYLAQKKKTLPTEQIELILDNMDRADDDAILPNTSRLTLDDDPDGSLNSRLREETDALRDQDKNAMMLLEEAVTAQFPSYTSLKETAALASIELNNGDKRSDVSDFILNPSRNFEIVGPDDPRRNPDNTAEYDGELDKRNRILEYALQFEVLLRTNISSNLMLINDFLSSTGLSTLYDHLLADRELITGERTDIKTYLSNPGTTTIDVTKPENFYLLNIIRSLHDTVVNEMSLVQAFVLDTNAPLSEVAIHLLNALRVPLAILERNYWPSSSWTVSTDWNVPDFTQEDLKAKRQRLVQDIYKSDYSTDANGDPVTSGNLDVFEEVMEFLYHSLPLKEIFNDPDFVNRFYINYGDTWAKSDQIAVQRFLSDAFPSLQGTRKTEAIEAIVDYFDGRGGVGSGDDNDKPNDVLIAEYIMNEQFCKYGYWGLAYQDPTAVDDDYLPVDGLCHILLDLDENIDTGIPNQVTPVLKRVKDRLHSNRSLCEDYVKISVVEQRPVALCINLEVAPSADEVDIAAEAIRRMQEYLSPVPRFRTFAQRLAELQEAGLNCSAEQIFDGPCLDNGFLVDEELGSDWLRDQYFHSDLLNEIMSVDGIVGLPALLVKATPEDAVDNAFEINTRYDVYGGDFPNPADDPSASYAKPVIDLEKSFIQVKKGARTYELNMQQVEDRLQLFRLLNSPDPLGPVGGPEWEPGVHRADLSYHRSVQYDLPANYMVGDNPPPADAGPKRKAQSKQLQAFLAFFDQILASYLHQLGQVRELLSVDQDAHAATWALPLMYDLPGLRDLIGHQTPFTATPEDWTIILQDFRDDVASISSGQGNEDGHSDRALAQMWLADYLDTSTTFTGFLAFQDELKTKGAMLNLPDRAADRYRSLYQPKLEAYFWEKFKADPENTYVRQMKDLAESPAEQQYRKNRLLDHLLARFGESFSEFATALLRPEAEPEDNPRQQSFEDYLIAKSSFLREVANLAKRRNLGYNYLAYRTVDNAAEIWNTPNVSGLQQRVVRKLGMTSWETRSLSSEPNYRIDRIKQTNKRGMTNYRAAIRRRLGDGEENPQEAVPLMLSPAYNSPRVAQDKINELYKHIWEAEYQEVTDELPTDQDYYWFRLSPVGRGGKFRAILYRNNLDSRKMIQQGPLEENTRNVEIVLQSELLSEDEAKNRILDELIPLTRTPETDRNHEGFHIVEHILLRPLEEDDPLLQLSLGCVPEETPKDPYSFWITVVVPAETTRFADLDFREFFEHTFRMEMPAHIAARFCYLNKDDMYHFEEAFAVWMFEKAKCDPPNYCREDVARARLVNLLNQLPCACGCTEEEPEPQCK